MLEEFWAVFRRMKNRVCRFTAKLKNKSFGFLLLKLFVERRPNQFGVLFGDGFHFFCMLPIEIHLPGILQNLFVVFLFCLPRIDVPFIRMRCALFYTAILFCFRCSGTIVSVRRACLW